MGLHCDKSFLYRSDDCGMVPRTLRGKKVVMLLFPPVTLWTVEIPEKMFLNVNIRGIENLHIDL